MIHRHRMTMTDVDRLLREYIERFESGGSSDPGDLLEQVEGREREKLTVLIQGYLEHSAPAQDWDAEGFEGSVAERAAARVAETWTEAAGELPLELVRLRNRQEITRSELVTRLAERLGVAGARERVATYYHQLERGLLPAGGVSSRVWDALAQLLETSADALRKAGASVRPTSAGGSAAAYARTAPPPPEEYAGEQRADEGMASPPEPESKEAAEVDRLFTGG